jgi:hypothetical protein
MAPPELPARERPALPPRQQSVLTFDLVEAPSILVGSSHAGQRPRLQRGTSRKGTAYSCESSRAARRSLGAMPRSPRSESSRKSESPKADSVAGRRSVSGAVSRDRSSSPNTGASQQQRSLVRRGSAYALTRLSVTPLTLEAAPSSRRSSAIAAADAQQCSTQSPDAAAVAAAEADSAASAVAALGITIPPPLAAIEAAAMRSFDSTSPTSPPRLAAAAATAALAHKEPLTPAALLQLQAAATQSAAAVAAATAAAGHSEAALSGWIAADWQSPRTAGRRSSGMSTAAAGVSRKQSWLSTAVGGRRRSSAAAADSAYDEYTAAVTAAAAGAAAAATTAAAVVPAVAAPRVSEVRRRVVDPALALLHVTPDRLQYDARCLAQRRIAARLQPAHRGLLRVRLQGPQLCEACIAERSQRSALQLSCSDFDSSSSSAVLQQQQQQRQRAPAQPPECALCGDDVALTWHEADTAHTSTTATAATAAVAVAAPWQMKWLLLAEGELWCAAKLHSGRARLMGSAGCWKRIMLTTHVSSSSSSMHARSTSIDQRVSKQCCSSAITSVAVCISECAVAITSDAQHAPACTLIRLGMVKLQLQRLCIRAFSTHAPACTVVNIAMLFLLLQASVNIEACTTAVTGMAISLRCPITGIGASLAPSDVKQLLLWAAVLVQPSCITSSIYETVHTVHSDEHTGSSEDAHGSAGAPQQDDIDSSSSTRDSGGTIDCLDWYAQYEQLRAQRQRHLVEPFCPVLIG